METGKLKKFAQFARRSLLEQVTAKLKLVLADESPARRESPQAIKKLEEAIAAQSKEQVIERVAYIWFNRFCALRFMDVNRYNRIGIVSPAEGQFQPEILADAKMGHIDEEMMSESTRQKIFALLDGKTPSQEPQGEAYRLLVVAACNYWYSAMPFLFERIDDYTELLMPDDLLSGNSILAYTREAMTPHACENVEVIGWLYQFYISEKKDQVFANLKKNKKVTPEDIPAATQLFTPRWIVRYLVENSLGRLWMLNRPDSGLIEQMDYYIKPKEPETEFIRISTPEEIKICDPACGSGHMLTYAFDLIYAIYEEEGYEPADIPAKILTHNLYGMEIDERAGELAAFALAMKAAEGNPKEEKSNHRRFFRNPIQPNICVLENIQFEEGELNEYMDFVGRDLFSAPLQTTLHQFKQTDNFGSLIRPDVTDVDSMLKILEAKNISGQLFISMTHQKVLKALLQADYLSPKYHVVIANPPYMGVKGMNDGLKKFLSDNYKSSKADLMTCFMIQANWLCLLEGYVGMINLPSWMFLSTFEKMRVEWLSSITIKSLLHLGRGIFGADFGTVAFVIQNKFSRHATGVYYRLFDRSSSVVSPEKKESLFKKGFGVNSFLQSHFFEIPGAPLAYWLPESAVDAYRSKEQLSDACYGQPGLQTSSNELFIRAWGEVSHNRIGFGFDNSIDASQSNYKWFPYLKGGEFRKWYGNHDFVVDWENDGQRIKSYVNEKYPYLNGNIDYVVKDRGYYFKKLISYTKVTIADFGARASDNGFLFDVAGSAIFPSEEEYGVILGFMCSKLSLYFAKAQNPTVNLQAGDVDRLPFRRSILESVKGDIIALVNKAHDLSTNDWDYSEKSWDFTSLPLMSHDYRQSTLKATYQKLRDQWREVTLEMQRLEEENNRILINAYDLHNELTPEVPLNEITLTCNPHYRYGNDKNEDEQEALLLADTMRELVSYAVGCMFGRYALDKPGLVLANQGETIQDYIKQIPKPSFPADDDNVIPMLSGDWFTDDITERFRDFLRMTFGEEHYEENLHFVEQALGKDIRKYFLKDFYNDHVRRYKKRPIYWLFSSPKGSFNALIYMHRYQPHTVGTVLEYLRDFKDEKLQARKNHLEAVSISAGASQGDKTKALTEIEKINKILAELDDYERDVLYPLATEQVEIDLDDGVKANYPKFGEALKKITGLSQ